MFQLPIVAFFLSRAGVIHPALMREYRKHAYIVILVLAAIITPSPDIISQNPGGVAPVRAVRSQHRRIGQRSPGPPQRT
jgi:Sec-independent protein secretion pathway component TatC